jgi:hypothetical protein
MQTSVPNALAIPRAVEQVLLRFAMRVAQALLQMAVKLPTLIALFLNMDPIKME